MTGTGDQPGGRSHSTVSVDLRERSSRWESSVLLGRSACVPGSRHGTVSARPVTRPHARFQAIEHRSFALPTASRHFPGSAPSRTSLTSKGSLPLSSLSYSQSAFVSADLRASSWALERASLPGRKRHRFRAPDAGDALKEPNEDMNPGSHMMALVPTPRGDLLRADRSAPALTNTASPRTAARSFPFAPIPH